MNTTPPESSPRPRHGRVVLLGAALLLLALLPACAREIPPDPRGGQLLAQLPGQATTLAWTAQDAARGSFDAFDEIASQRQRLQRDLDALRRGDPARAIAPPPPAAQADVDRVAARWNRLDEDSARLLALQDTVLGFVDQAQDLSLALPQLAARYDLAQQAFAESGGSPAQLILAGRLVLLTERLQRRLIVLANGAESMSAADILLRDCSLASKILASLRDGDGEQGLPAATGAAAEALGQARPLQQELQQACEAAVEAASSLLEAQEFAAQMRMNVAELDDAVQAALAHWH
jgi:twitching motility protein PilJ